MANSLLDVKNLSVIVHHQCQKLMLLKEVNFSLNKGETLAIVGESGSGKTLTALAIMQLLPPGTYIEPSSIISLQGEDLLTFSELRMRTVRGKKIAIVFQEATSALNPILTIGEQITEVLKFHLKLKRKERHARAISLLKEVGIENSAHYLEAYPHQLSGGLKQRAMIALALAGEPDLLIADEPTTALDVTLQAQVIELLKKLQKKRKMSLIFITHDIGIVYEIANQVIVLYKGEIVEAALKETFFKAPTHPYSRKLFLSLPGWLQPPLKKGTKKTDTLLVIKRLKVHYPIKKGIFQRTVGYIKAVDGISLELKKGHTLALVGESGSGKTTTGMAILRLIKMTDGQILLNNQKVDQLGRNQLKQYRSDIQVVFQDPIGSMNPRMLVKDIISEGLRAKKLSVTDKMCKVDELLEYVGLNRDHKDRYPHEFSGGQRQRICIARALAMEPQLLICDEPTSALDVSAQMQILTLLTKLQNEMGLTYLLITHNIAVVGYLADEIAVMKNGIIVERGLAADVLYHPQHPYTIKLLSAVPKVPQMESINLVDRQKR